MCCDLQAILELLEWIVVILDRGKCANNPITAEQSAETRYPGFILLVSFDDVLFPTSFWIPITSRVVEIVKYLNNRYLVFVDRNGEDSRIFCHHGHAKSGDILHPEYSAIGHGGVQGKSCHCLQQDRGHEVGFRVCSK